MLFFFKKIFVFFIIFIQLNLKCGDDSPKILFSSDIYIGIDCISYDHFKIGVQAGVSSFSYRIWIDKIFSNIGFYTHINDILSIESFIISFNSICNIKSLQSLNVIGYDLFVTFRTWNYPINIGIIFSKLKVSPKISFGVVAHFTYQYSRFNLRTGINLSYILDKHSEGLLENKDYYSIFLDQKVLDLRLDESCLKLIENNRDIFKKNDAYFSNFIKLIECQPIIESIMQEMNSFSNIGDWDKYDTLYDKFQDETLENLKQILEKSYLIVVRSNLKIKYFEKHQIDMYNSFIKELDIKIEKESDKIYFIKNDDNGIYNCLNYLRLKIIKVLLNSVYLVEFHESYDNSIIGERELLLDS